MLRRARNNYLSLASQKARHIKPSIIASLDDDHSTQSCEELVETLARASLTAINTKIIGDNNKPDSIYLNIFPGEHYKLLAGLIIELQPSFLIDIGTYTGMSSRVMLDHTSLETQIHTFDIVGYDKFDSHLKINDFETRLFYQHLDDLSDQDTFSRYAEFFDQADLIFCDAPKDGRFEYEFMTLLSQNKLSNKPRLLILDDIKFENMWELWRMIRSPKLDATSFGHWSGTGLVDISKGLRFEKL